MPGKSLCGMCAMAAAIGVGGIVAPAANAQVSFTKSSLQNIANLTHPTSLQFGPDDRLYVAQQDGQIHVFTIARPEPGQYEVVAQETITLIHTIPNHNDDGSPNATVKRQCTGILVVGTAANPVIYATSSDWRIAIGVDSGLDTNSGIISRLTWDGAQWNKLDLVRGLPRCEENHAANGMVLDDATNTLYVAQGGNTNMGAPSANFAELPEYALAAAILSVDLTAIGETTYDIPTLDDPSRANVEPGIDDNDPFGGNDGANQAMIVAGGPVQVYAPGFRNAYDLVLTADGRMYTIDNGPNAGWGGPPTDCTNAIREAGSATFPDGLHFVSGPGYYGGHPNPFRADNTNVINGQSPVPASNPIECSYLEPGAADGALVTWTSSVNGLVEYQASNFEGAMQGDLLAAAYNGNAIYRITLNATGDGVVSATTLFPTVGGNTLDVWAVDDNGLFPGTVWVTDHAQSNIYVFEPSDASFCTGANDPALDEDEDGYMNDDEIANGTDPCSAGSVPPDNDGDFISDLFDNDDDNDGVLDPVDPFAIDAANGLATTLPLHYNWGVGDPGFGIAGLGFTGLMSDGVTDWSDLFDPARLTPGGAAGMFTIDDVTQGNALGAANTQDSAFQFGFPCDETSGPLLITTRVDVPSFGAALPTDARAVGLYLGDGTQSTFARLAIEPGFSDPAFTLIEEEGDVPNAIFRIEDEDLSAASTAELALVIDPAYGMAQARIAIDAQPPRYIGLAHPLHDTLHGVLQGAQAPAVGVIATADGGPTFNATWDEISVTPITTGARANVRIDPPGPGIDNSTFVGGSFGIDNTSTGGQYITRIVIDLRTVILQDMNYDIDGTGGDSTFKAFEPTTDPGVGLLGATYLVPHPKGGGFDVLEIDFDDFAPGEFFTFAIDVDPHHIAGAPAPGPNGSGHVSGLELTGATWTMGFDDGSSLVTRVFPKQASEDGSANVIKAPAAPAPAIELLNQGVSPIETDFPEQTLRITGAPGNVARVVILECGRFTDGLVDPESVGEFQANKALGAFEYSATIEADGKVDLPITLVRTEADGGFNHIVAAFTDGGVHETSAMSNLIIARLGCTGDLDGDGAVGLTDLQLLLFGFGTAEPGDINEDGFVDLADLQLMLANFGQSCS